MKSYKFILFIICVFTLTSCFSAKEIQTDVINIISFGANPNNAIDCTDIIQEAIDSAYKNKVFKVFFPKGIYHCNSITIYPGIELIGEEGTVLRKVSNAGKWSRMLTTYSNDYKYKSDKDSPTLIIRNISFNGNFSNQGDFEQYQLEQQHLIFIAADRNSKGRIKAVIDNCHFEESVADAISIYHNSDVVVTNCIVENVFRGGITITGGNSITRVNNFKAFGNRFKTGIDVEIDGPGFEKTFDIDLELRNIDLAGDFDIAIRGGIVNIESLISHSSPFNILGAEGEINIRNSTFYLTEGPNLIYYPNKITFESCKFYFISKKNAGINIVNNTSYRTSNGNNLKFKNSFFVSKVKEGSPYGIKVSPDDIDNNNMMIFEKCLFRNFDTGIWLPQGGSMIVKESIFECNIGVSLNETPTYNYNFLIEDSDMKKTNNPIKTYNVSQKSIKREINLKIANE